MANQAQPSIAAHLSETADQPPPVDISHHYSKTTKDRNISGVKDFYKYFRIPGVANLAGGLPNHNYFPFDTLEGSTAPSRRFVPTPNKPGRLNPEQVATLDLADSNVAPASRILVPNTSENPNLLRKIDVKSALQYGTSQGYPPLYSFLRQFTREQMHPNVPYKDGPEIILTTGSTDGFAKTLEALTDPWHQGDQTECRQGMLVEECCYMNAVQAARPRGLNIVPVAMDQEGMCAESVGGLFDVLENWDPCQGKRPHILYTVTVGQNPTSGTLGVSRRKAIYALCVRYDVLIIEDDPYWYLQYPSANSESLACRSKPTSSDARPGEPHDSSFHSHAGASVPYQYKHSGRVKSSGYDFLDSLVPSYLSVDYEGRVIRLDTFSKTIAPGCRLGWITTQPALCERLLRITETSTQQPSGFVQSMVAELIMGPHSRHARGGKGEKGWKTDGWVRWLEGLRGNYERRMNAICNILEGGKHVVQIGRFKSPVAAEASGRRENGGGEDDGWSVVAKTQIYDFVWPLGGMFIWLHINFPAHPLYKKVNDHEKLAKALFVHLTTPHYRILVCPGAMFAPTEEIRAEKAWQYVRVCFAAVDEDQLDALSRSLVAGITSFWEKKTVADIESLVEATAEEAEDVTSLAGFGC